MSRKRKQKNIDKVVNFTFTNRLEKVLMDISDNISYAIMGSYMTTNTHGYKLLDMSTEDNFRVYIQGKKPEKIDIKEFLNNFFNSKFSDREIDAFIYDYNQRLDIQQEELSYQLIDVFPYEQKEFEYKPKDVFYTFNSLCYQTYPHGTEQEILKYIPIPLKEDKYGNYYIKIGESNTMFTSHFDSACKDFTTVRLMSFDKSGHTFISSDGSTILSGDDKAGVTIMLYMIEHNVPGLYYFFLGEEVGGIGSGHLSRNFDKHEHLKGINKCVSFDRRNYHSIITHQSFTRTCSDAFAKSLCKQFEDQGMVYDLDNTGSFTDSANFIQHISECTNVSVGYFNEHTTGEYVNITFLEDLCKACVNIQWDTLTINRNVGYNREIVDKNYDMLMDFKKLTFFNDVKLKAFEDRIFMQLIVAGSAFHENYEDLADLNTLFDKYNLNPYIHLSDDTNGTMLMNIEIE